jgi:hypothetical protein
MTGLLKSLQDLFIIIKVLGLVAANHKSGSYLREIRKILFEIFLDIFGENLIKYSILQF